MPIPKIQPLLLPVLRMVADGKSVEKIRERLKEQFQITAAEAEQIYAGSGDNVFVNRVAWALAHLVMGGLIRKVGITDGNYQITDNGIARLNGNPSELTISELH